MNRRFIIIGAAIAGGVVFLFIIALIAAMLITGQRGSMVGSGIGLITVEGVIVDGQETIEQLRSFRDDSRVKVIVLRIDSPGGVVAPSQEIYDEVKRTVAEKKVVVSMGSVAASGGYYIASPATMIYANPGTITGSIGVIMKFSNIEGLLDKIGLKANTLKSGPFKDIGSATRPMTPADQAVLQGVIDSIQSQFVRAVASGRKLPEAKVRELADGRIFSGEQAVKLKLVDKLGGLQDAIDKAAVLADIKGEPRIIYPPKKKRHFMDLLVEEAMEDFVAAVSRQQGMSARYQLEGR